MEMFLVIYDNGCQYEDNENYVDAIFDSYEKAHEYCINEGYEEHQKVKGYYEKRKNMWNFFEKSLEIKSTKLNEKVEW